MSFFDEGDDPRTAIRSPQPQPRRPPDRARRSSADDRTLLLRRAAAAGIVLVVLIALVLGIKALLNHQAVQGLKDYNNKVAGLVDGPEGEQALVRTPFFQAIAGAFNSANPSQVAITIQGEVHQEQLFYQQAQGWSVPSQMVGAQRQFVQTLGLRYEALQAIAGEMTSALGSTNASTSDQGTAINEIAGNMQLLLASDVIYAERVAPLITPGPQPGRNHRPDGCRQHLPARHQLAQPANRRAADPRLRPDLPGRRNPSRGPVQRP